MPDAKDNSSVSDRDALGFNVRDACEEPLMRLEQAGNILHMVFERISSSTPTAAGALALAHTTLLNEVEALRKALRLSNAN